MGPCRAFPPAEEGPEAAHGFHALNPESACPTPMGPPRTGSPRSALDMVWALPHGQAWVAWRGIAMSQRPAERIPGERRLRAQADFTRLKAQGRAVRGAHCLVVVEACPGEPTKVAFVASRKGVGDAVRRNRARRRMREIVRRHWPEISTEGVRMMFVAYRSILTAPHPELAGDVERLLVLAGALRPAENR